MQKITKPVTTYTDVYLADDGVEFECEYSCKQHEELVKLFHEGEPLKHGKSLWLPQNFAVDPSDDVMKPIVKDGNYYYGLSTINQILYFLRNGWRVPKVEEQESLIKEMKDAAADIGLKWHDYDAGEDAWDDSHKGKWVSNTTRNESRN